MSDTMSAPQVAHGAEAYDFGRLSSVTDVGGDDGALLSAILAAHRVVRRVLFDLPHVVATARDVLERAGVQDRCEVVRELLRRGAGCRRRLRSGGGDHDWDNAAASAILRRCRAAMAADGRVLVVERELAPPNQGATVKFSELNMLVFPGGRERTRGEFEALLPAAGFRLAAALPAASSPSVFEGVRA